MSYSLNSLKGVIKGIIMESAIGVIKGDTRSLDNGSDLPSISPLYVPHAATYGVHKSGML